MNMTMFDNKAMNSPLHYAILQENNEIFNLLLKYGANPNKGNFINRTPLHVSAKKNNLKFIKVKFSFRIF